MKNNHMKKIGILLIAALITSVAAASVLALFLKSTDKVENIFTPAVSANPLINETFRNNLKEDVSIEITDKGYPVYVRCAIVVNWKDKNGNVRIENPIEDTDYILEIGGDWTKKDDGFYYYNSPIQTGNTSPFIVKCEPANESPYTEYFLSVNIISQTIQAVGTTDEGDIPAHMDGWKADLQHCSQN
ncbi:MAG: hypothetical protein IKK66_11805 [Ruminococcus sp.]|nr:hypothetical protein [Ruminococcus sp.]MBR6581965.1 hypothetical protein [Ruminococcus sp.]